MKNKQKIFIAFVLLVLASLFTLAADGTFSGMLRDYAAVRLENMDMPVHEQTVDIVYEHTSDLGRLTLHPVVYNNPNKTLQFDLSEAYFDFYLDSADVRIGKQKII